MDKIGIVCEYNPFHNGHKYHIDKIKEMFPNSLIILILSGNYTQRGDISIINKFDKTSIALKNNVDLVIELPTIFTIQSADIFTKGAIDLLNLFKVDYLVFGSESNDIDKLYKISKIQNNDEYNKEVKKLLSKGFNYKNALNKALNKFNIDEINESNDILGIGYIKEIINLKSKIKPITIQRTNDFNKNEIKGNIISANTIRNNIDSIDIKKYVPKNALIDYYKIDYFNLLKYKIISDNNLNNYNLVDEGIENRLVKYINKCDNLDDYINKIKCKRYNINKIKRMLISILIGLTKEEVNDNKEIKYIRILGFNNNGQKYLNKIKKEIDIPIYSKFNKNLEKELNYTKIYSMIVNDNTLTIKEIKNSVIKY